MSAAPIFYELPAAFVPDDPTLWAAAFTDLSGLSFFDSALRMGDLGRYSFIAPDPFHVVAAQDGVTFCDDRVEACDPFALMARLQDRYRLETIAGLPPFQTGLAGYLGYGLRHYLEDVPAHGINDAAYPDMLLGCYDLVIAIDHRDRRAFVISSGHPEIGPDAQRRRAHARLDWALRRLADAPSAIPSLRGIAMPIPDLPAGRYQDMVRRTIAYINAGDIYQANITQRFRTILPTEMNRLALYATLRRRNPATFAAYVDFGRTALLSASPERFLQLRGDMVETRPIKGTRPRSPDSAEDRALADALLASAKDRAENLMIVDLLRNDLSRVCRMGSVKVPVLFGLESYRTVHHLVSVVKGRLANGCGAIDLLRAAFPGGSITGAPKIRAMEIIAMLEPTSRGPYCGSIGYFGFDGAMDTNIVIRSYALQGNMLSLQAGCGIVADSDPDAEYAESLLKARALIDTLAASDEDALREVVP